MADHGFGKTKAKSSITDDEIDRIVKEISEQPYCIRAWRVSNPIGGHDANIYWAFKHIGHVPPLGSWTHETMVADVKRIVKKHEHTAWDTDVYIKHSEYAQGEFVDDEDAQGEDAQ